MSRLIFLCMSLVIVCASVNADAQDVKEPAPEEKPAPPGKAKTWWDSIVWEGDLRLRYEGIDEAGEEERSRFRFRSRFGIGSNLTDRTEFYVRIATSDGDPVSTNLTFGDGFSTKDIALDRMFIDWNVISDLDLRFGKMGTPWFKAGGNSLLWDSDLNPEGIVGIWQSGMIFANLGTFAVVERSDSDDTLLHAAQVGLNFNLSETARLRFAAAYFDYTNTIGNAPFYEGKAKGNSVDIDGNLIYDYDILEISADISGSVAGWRATAFGVWAQNTAVDEQDTAFALGVRFGAINQKGDVQFSYAWHDTEADAIMGIFSDSDFGGGSTDSRGHFVKAKYALRHNILLGATFIISEIEEFVGNQHDYDRIQLDIEFLFQ